MKKARTFVYARGMKKGTATRTLILNHAVARASEVGLDGLSIGQLARELDLSKSGLFGHFTSKTDLQIQILETVTEQFTREVVKPALKAPRGVQRLEHLFMKWLHWASSKDSERKGCPFMAAAMELDDQPGPVRDKLVQTQQQLIDVLERTIQLGQQSHGFDPEYDPAAGAQELYGFILSFHFYNRLMKDPLAEARARKNFQRFVKRLTLQGETR